MEDDAAMVGPVEALMLMLLDGQCIKRLVLLGLGAEMSKTSLMELFLVLLLCMWSLEIEQRAKSIARVAARWRLSVLLVGMLLLFDRVPELLDQVSFNR